jgi:site-specific recombinase XerD
MQQSNKQESLGKNRETAQFHTIAFTLIKRDGASDTRMHTLYLLSPDSDPLPFEPLLDYFHHTGQTKSLAWQKEVAYSIGLFIDFIAAHEKLSQATRSAGKAPAPAVLFSNFASGLTRGTIDRTGIDPLGLYWEAKSVARASKILSNVTLFSDWSHARLGTAQVNPWRQADFAERMAAMRAIDKRSPHQLLGYLGTAGKKSAWSDTTRSVGLDRKLLTSQPKEPKIFPDGKVLDLINKGFAKPGCIESDPLHVRISLRNAMIVALMHGGGLRESEAFHLYVSDVGVDPLNPNSATVRLYHPAQGLAPPDFIDPITGQRILTDRATYLMQRYGLLPRNEQAGRFSAGFKDLFMTDARELFAQVHWFPSVWGEIFLTLFKSYIFHERKRVANHPYLLVSGKTGYAGEPYTVDSFRQAHGLACHKIGLAPSKDMGTTPHGHRHAYGQALAGAHVDELIIQRAMHHKSIQSQRAYTAPTQAQIFEALAAAESTLQLNGSTAIKPYAPESLKLLSPFTSGLSFK